MPLNVKALFEEELLQRGLEFEIEPESSRHSVKVNGLTVLMSPAPTGPIFCLVA